MLKQKEMNQKMRFHAICATAEQASSQLSSETPEWEDGFVNAMERKLNVLGNLKSRC